MKSSSSYTRTDKKSEVAQVKDGILKTNTTDTITENIDEAPIGVQPPNLGSEAGNTRLRKSASSRTIREAWRFEPYNSKKRLRRGERVVLRASTTTTVSQVFTERVE